MQNTTSAIAKYHLSARIFHWIGALLILVAYVLASLGDDYISLHKSIGFSFLIWTLLRVINRFVIRAPALNVMKKWQVVLAHLVHLLLYVMMLLMPITGMMASIQAGYGVDVFGLFQIQGVDMANRALAGQLMNTHKNIIWPALLVLIVVHILGALYHQLVLKDNLISRMR